MLTMIAPILQAGVACFYFAGPCRANKPIGSGAGKTKHKRKNKSNKQFVRHINLFMPRN